MTEALEFPHLHEMLLRNRFVIRGEAHYRHVLQFGKPPLQTNLSWREKGERIKETNAGPPRIAFFKGIALVQIVLCNWRLVES